LGPDLFLHLAGHQGSLQTDGFRSGLGDHPALLHHKELALALYQRGALSLGKARLLAQMAYWELEELKKFYACITITPSVCGFVVNIYRLKAGVRR
jgi:hypothetical protein